MGIPRNRGFWISSSHTPGVKNTMADKMLRVFNSNTEWMLSHKLYKRLCDKFQFNPETVLFATCLNKPIDKYVSWMPDPYCIAVKTFNFSCKPHKTYGFPLFSPVGAAMSKFIKENTTGIMIIPRSITQYWFPTMLAHLVDQSPVSSLCD